MLQWRWVLVAQSAGLERCYEPMAEGNCSEKIERWYFNYKTGLCQPFTYTGCAGNDNNFNSTDYCNHACQRAAGRQYSFMQRLSNKNLIFVLVLMISLITVILQKINVYTRGTVYQ